MPDLSLEQRVADYLDRQESWLNAQLAACQSLLEKIDSNPADDYADALSASSQAQRELDNLEREQRGLLAEWKSVNQDDPARAGIQMQSRRVAALAAELTILQGKIMQGITTRRAEIVEQGRALGRGRETLQGYKPGQPAGSDILDRHA